MLRLQPSEIGLTSTDVHDFKRRLEYRRQARAQQGLNEEILAAHHQHLRIQRGPARFRDEALHTQIHPVALSYSVFDSSDGCSVDDLEQVAGKNSNAASSNDESLIISRQSDTTSEEAVHTLVEKEEDLSVNAVDRQKQSDSTLWFRGGDHNEPEIDEKVLPDDTHYCHNSSLRSYAYPHRVEESPSTSPKPEKHIPQIDGAGPAFGINDDGFPNSDVVAEESKCAGRPRKYRPRSWSDPQDSILPPLQLLPRRNLSRYVPHSDHVPATTSKAQAFTDQDKPFQSSSSDARQSIDDSNPAVLAALRNSPSPLDKLIYASQALSLSNEVWQAELPFRPREDFNPNLHSSQRQHAEVEAKNTERGQRSSLPCRTISPTEHSTEAESESTPKPFRPGPRHQSMVDGNDEEPLLPLTPHRSALVHPARRQFSFAPLDDTSQFTAATHSSLPNRGRTHDREHTSASPPRTALCRRNAIHHSSSSIDASDSADPGDSPQRRRRPRRINKGQPSTPNLAHEPHTGYSGRMPNALENEKAAFFRTLTQANSGELPLDAARRWLLHLQQRASHQSKQPRGNSGTDPELASPADKERPEPSQVPRNSPIDELDPFASSKLSQSSSPPLPPLRRAPPLEFAIARGGRPVSDAPMVRRSMIPRRLVYRSSKDSSDQENIDGDAFRYFENERTIRAQRIASHRPGDPGGYGADGEDDVDDATPPRTGRLERFLS